MEKPERIFVTGFMGSDRAGLGEKLAEEYRAKTEAYDRELDRQSERELKEIRNKLERENAEAIARLEADMETSLVFIEKNYAEQTDLRADEIVGRILEANE